MILSLKPNEYYFTIKKLSKSISLLLYSFTWINFKVELDMNYLLIAVIISIMFLSFVIIFRVNAREYFLTNTTLMIITFIIALVIMHVTIIF